MSLAKLITYQRSISFTIYNHLVQHNSKSSPLSQDAMMDVRVVDPTQSLVDFSALSDNEITQITGVLTAIKRWRESEQAISFQSRSDMHLGENDMKALRFLVAAQHQHLVVTPGSLAEHLAISTASTTKLLDRLESAGHIHRSPHPTDRRALMISITTATHEHVRDTVGRTHARRFDVAARLSPQEREVVVRFLNDLSGPDSAPPPRAEPRPENTRPQP